MPNRTYARAALLAVLASLALVLSGGAAPVTATAQPTTFTSPIDVTGLRVRLQASAPDRDSGQPVNVTLPVELLGPKFRAMTEKPLSQQIDEYWSVRVDPKLGKTPRQDACDRIRQQLDDAVKEAPAGFSVYDYACNLATTGSLLVRREGPAHTFGYTLFGSSIEAYVTTPYTCNRNTFAPLCPNDPGVKVTLVPQLVMTLRTPELCRMTATDGTAVLQAPSLEPLGVLNVAELADNVLFGGWYGNLAQDALRRVTMEVPLPLDDALKELRDSAPCTDRTSPAGRIAAAFKDVEVAIEPAQGTIFLRASHPAIAAPRFQNVDLPYGPDTCKQGFVWREAFAGDHVCVTPETRTQAAADNAAAASRREPNGGAYGPNTCRSGFVWREARPEDLVCVTPETRSQTATDNAQADQRRELGFTPTPGFLYPVISAPPTATPGSTITVSGSYFPRTADPTVLFLRLERDATAACLGGGTELEWGPANGTMRVEKLPTDLLSCTGRHEMKNLSPSTSYRFRARDCDAITCSPWSAPVTLTTAARSSGAGPVTLTIDGAALGTATVSATGTFDADVTVPAGTAAGNRTIRAVSGDTNVTTSIQVTTAGAPSRATLIITSSNVGDRGCPMRPWPDYLGQPAITAGFTFSAAGTGFAPGTVTLRLDSATGASFGSATVGANGSFCRADFTAPTTSQIGNNRTLVAVQNGMVVASIPIRVIRDDQPR